METSSKCRWLVLVPTEFELSRMRPHFPPFFDGDDVLISICGFGVVASAARSSQLIAQTNPENVLLLGIAGAYSEHLSIGSAAIFSEVVCHGVGVGEADEFESAGKIGWLQYKSTEFEIGDRLDLVSNDNQKRTLLTCNSASRNKNDVTRRLARFVNAVAEDMEGFAVAMACEMANIKQRFVIRGISNRAGDRNKDHWQIDAALKSACELASALDFSVTNNPTN